MPGLRIMHKPVSIALPLICGILVLLLNSVQAETLYESTEPANLQPRYDERGQSLPVMTESNLRRHDQQFKSETLEATLYPQSEMEFMTTIDQGEVMLFAWETSEPLYHDFHGHQPGVNPDVWTRYSDGTASREQGSVVAPYTGEHGWYWVNEGDNPVTIKLSLSGYYKTVFRVDLSGTSK